MKKGKKIWILAAGIALLATIVIISIYSSRMDTVPVQTAIVERKDVLNSKVTASGELRAKQFVDLQPEISGIITELYVHEGDAVKKGDILLRIDPIQTDAEMTSARAQYDAAAAEARGQQFEIANAEINLLRDETSLKSAQAELERAEYNFAKSQRTYNRNQELYEDGVISREEYENFQNEFRSAQASLEVQKANVASMEKAIEIARNNIARMKTAAEASQARMKQAAANLTKANDQSKKSKIESPLDGVITHLNKEQGERAVPGMMSNPEATIMTIADLSIIQAEIKVDETDVVNVSLGDKTEVQVDALPDEIFEGEVTEIGNSPIQSSSASQEAKDFKVIVTLKNPSPKLRPGMSCTSDITTDVKTNALVIPIQALTVRDVEVDEDGKYHEPDLDSTRTGSVARAASDKEDVQKKELEGVFVVNKDVVARFRPVKTGITGESEIEVLENLEEGDEIVSGSFQTLRTIKDGAAVKIEKRMKSQARS
jgi:HlyD family secretion protein